LIIIFFIIQTMYILYTKNLITSYKNLPLFFAQGGCLEENLKANKRGTLKKYSSKIFTSYIPQIWLQVRKIYPLYLHKVAAFKEKIGRQIRGAPWTITCEVACYFEYKFLNFYSQFFLSSKRCTSYIPQFWLQVRKINPYYFHKVAAFKKKIGRQIRGAPWTNTWEVVCYYKFWNFDNQFILSSKRCTSYIPQIWFQVSNINPYYLHKVAASKKKMIGK